MRFDVEQPVPGRIRKTALAMSATFVLAGAFVLLKPQSAAACELENPVTFIGGCKDHKFIGLVHLGFGGFWAEAENGFIGLGQVSMHNYVGEKFIGLFQAGLVNDMSGPQFSLLQVGLANNTGIEIERTVADEAFLFGTFNMYDYDYHFSTSRGYSFNLLQVAGIYNVCGECSLIQAALLFNYAIAQYGLQIAFYNEAKTLGGIQASYLYGNAENMYGLQLAALTHATDVRGVQLGVVNLAQTVKGLQIGLYNQTQKLGGVQLGFLNIAGDNWLPWMVLLNVGFY